MRTILLLCLLVGFCEGSVNFVHIPKTGGTTLHFTLLTKFQRDRVYPIRKVVEDERVAITSREGMEAVFAAFPTIAHDFISGHFPFWFFKEKDPFFATSYFFTVLRDPIARVLSHARYRIKEAGRRDEVTFSDLAKIAPNLMCKVLASDPTLEGDELLADCISTLHRMNFIIFMDDFERGVKSLCRDLGFSVPKTIPRYNTTERKPIDHEVVAQIKERNALDLALYEYATTHLRHKHSH